MLKQSQQCAPVQSSVGATAPSTYLKRTRKTSTLRKWRYCNASESRDNVSVDGNQGGGESFAPSVSSSSTAEVPELNAPSPQQVR